MRLENVGIVGNCQFAALIDRTGTVIWSCLPRFDAEPVFGALLDERAGGRFTIGPPQVSTSASTDAATDAGRPLGHQRYLANTNVLETTLHARPRARFA